MLVERLVANEVSSAPCLTTEPDGELAASMQAESHMSCCACYMIQMLIGQLHHAPQRHKIAISALFGTMTAAMMLTC